MLYGSRQVVVTKKAAPKGAALRIAESARKWSGRWESNPRQPAWKELFWLPYDSVVGVIPTALVGQIQIAATPTPEPTVVSLLLSSDLSQYEHPEGLYSNLYPTDWQVTPPTGPTGTANKVLFEDLAKKMSLAIEHEIIQDFEYDLEIYANRMLHEAVQEVSGFSPITTLEMRDADNWYVSYVHICGTTKEECYSEERFVSSGNKFFRVKTTRLSDIPIEEQVLIDRLLWSLETK